MILLDQRFPIQTGVARVIRAALLDAAPRLNLPTGPVQDLITAASEIVNNIIEHSRAPRAQTIHVCLRLTVETLSLTLEDDGGPFEAFNSVAKRPALNPFDDSVEEGGYGLFLIRRLFPDHSYEAGPPNRFSIARNLARRRPRLLLIEDETTLRRLYETMLLPIYDVVGCTTAAEALALASLTKPDLILSDINLPDQMGLDLLTQITRDPNSPPVPIIVFSGSRTPEIEARANRLGIDDFLEKPVTRATLLKTVDRALGRAGRDRAQMLGHMQSRLTRSIAPEAPSRFGPFRCALASRPISVGGGDMLVRLTNGEQERLLLGDVMGHGLEAKLMAHVLAGYVRGLVQGLGEQGFSANDLLRRLSRAIAEDRLLQDCLMTGMIIEPLGPGRLRLTNAGHPEPLILSETPRELTTHPGPVIGLVRDPDYPSIDISLGKGERLLIVTDGIFPHTQSVGLPEDVLAALTPILNDLRSLPLSEAIVAVTQYLNAQELSDDWTILLIEPEPL
ncbi:hypothetical protein VZ95_02955 [Elstera litoralis]|uniref:Response regulatory domain-containing protein n=1 Tax=Elstera litoralis TaxID=552518 RepID=A0A0F3IVS3_9PROT|nr:SpoIIE family protein phosphatase [Elstera litoralis]KJV10732.1 hypothetical protein VZ95_02955 [Elstera litoralis]